MHTDLPSASGDVPFGQWVKQRRKWLDLTQPQLADRVGCAVITLQKIEANALRPSNQIARRLAQALQIPSDAREHFVDAARMMMPKAASQKAATHTATASPITRFARLIGREQDVAAICQMLRQSEIRLLTLAGPPGVGKTRLAQELAIQAPSRLPGLFADGVVYVSLAEVQDALGVAPAIAHALRIKDSPGKMPLDQLQHFLQRRCALLILDNFEHVLPASALLPALLMAAPEVKVLVTSRVLLKVSGEHKYSVSPLALPNLAQLPSPAQLAQQAGVALFVERATAVNSAFALTPTTARAVAEICVRLDGLPLAIELAAARCRLLGPLALQKRLEQRLPLLENNDDSLPTRQRRMRDAIAWSYEQLGREEQLLFNRLGVFVGGWTTEAVEAISEEDGANPFHVLDGLAELLDSSLIVQQAGDADAGSDADNEPRFTMLETLREFALSHLAESGELADMQRRHAAYFLHLARENEMQMLSPRQAEVLRLLDSEHDNFRAALRWSLVHDGVTALELSGRLYFFWQLRSYFREGRSWLEQALALNPTKELSNDLQDHSQQTVSRARALYGLGTLAYCQSDYEHATQSLERALVLRRELGDKRSQATLLNVLGQIADERGDLDRAGALWEEGHALAQAIDDKQRMTATLSNLGVLAFKRGDFELAKIRQEAAIGLARTTGSKYNIAAALNELGNVALKLGDVARATLCQEECLALAREIEDKSMHAYALVGLGDVARYHGTFERAQRLYEDSLTLRRELDHRWGIGISLAHLGHTASLQGQFGRAAAVLNESLSIFRALGDSAATALALNWLGEMGLAMGNFEQARQWHTEAMSLQQQLGDKAGVSISLNGLARVDAMSGQPLGLTAKH